MSNKEILYLIVPCYNEEEVLADTAKQLTQKLGTLIEDGIISPDSRILFVDDGSIDNTWGMIYDLHNEQSSAISGLRLATNVGHQNAILAGLFNAVEYCDITITIDADLQQDINAIGHFLDKYHEGNDIVYGIRNTRNTDSFFKKATASLFYGIMKLLGAKIIKNSADYRLLSKKAIVALMQYNETNLFLRGILPLVGFKSDVVHFDVKKRLAGTSKYTLAKMFSLALNGITSFSVKPIRAIMAIGVISFLASLIIAIVHAVLYFMGQIPTPGLTTIVLSIWALGGLQLVAIGIVGEYIGKTYIETKRRPRYEIWEFVK